jgi:hypothetical protein
MSRVGMRVDTKAERDALGGLVGLLPMIGKSATPQRRVIGEGRVVHCFLYEKDIDYKKREYEGGAEGAVM